MEHILNLTNVYLLYSKSIIITVVVSHRYKSLCMKEVDDQVVFRVQ